MKSPFIVPIAGKNVSLDKKISDEEIKLLAWIIAEGSIENSGQKHRHCKRVTIYQSKIKNPRGYNEIISLLDYFALNYSIGDSCPAFGDSVKMIRLNAESSRKIHKMFGVDNCVGFIPDRLFNLSCRQARVFLDTYLKADGFEGCKIATTSKNILDGLQQIAVSAEYGFSVICRKPTIGRKEIYVLRLIKHKDTYIQKIENVNYSGIIWCPNTDNETVIARRNGKVFITGNTPFTNLTMDLKVPSYMADEHVVIGGQPQMETYKDFEVEMEMINRAFAECMLEGDASGRVFTFPIPTYNITKDFDWDNKDHDLIWEMTAKYGIPYFSNFINSDMKPEDARSMCCRLRIDNTQLRKRGGGLFGANPLTGSIGVVTINMPRLGYVSTGEDDFIARLDRLMELAKESLEIKRKAIENFTEVGLYPYSKFYLRQVHQRFGEYWKNHFSTIGLLGMNESITNFLPGENITTEKGHGFAVKIMDFMRGKLEEFQTETGSIYNLEATPGEGTTYRFARMDKKRFGRVLVANEEAYQNGANPYYTNSTQLPVNFTEDVFEALDLQDELQCKYTGGCIEKGNKVLTDKGLIKIEDIVRDFDKIKPIKVLSYNDQEGVGEWDEISDAMKIDVKKHDKIRVRGEKNLDIVTSDWHPFFVLEKIKVKSICPICEKKIEGVKSFANHLRMSKFCREKYKNYNKYAVVERRADELKRGDYVLQNSFNLYPNKKTKLDSDMMWLIGFFIGDGCISKLVDNRGGNNIKKYSVRFFSSNVKVLAKVKKILFEKFGVEISVIKNDKRSEVLRRVGTSSKNVLDFFFKCGFVVGKKVYDVRIPDFVKSNLNSSNVFSLLTGLMDSDGHISGRDGDLEYSTVSPNLADDLLEVFSVAGINIGKYSKESKRANEKKIYRLRIPQYYLSFIRDKIDANVNVLNIREKVSNRKKRHLPVVRVKECSKTNVEDNMFYDLTTKKNHNYLAGKDCLVFVHNTVFHTFVGEKMSKDSVRAMVKKIAYNYHLPYFTITPTFSVCPVHGYLNGEHEYCPKCDEELAEIEATPISVADADEVGKESNEFSGEALVGHDSSKDDSSKSSGEPDTLEAPFTNSQINLGGDINGANKM
ncbi:MAG: ribonucleoside triphosphate reductase [Nanoarchaeota archaeon]|nr:ribonucleoside triphosphate reductase [Nanoarchaeota archaeon]